MGGNMTFSTVELFQLLYSEYKYNIWILTTNEVEADKSRHAI